jgi:hypothetical protein
MPHIEQTPPHLHSFRVVVPMVKTGLGVLAASVFVLLVSATVVKAPDWTVQDSFARAVWTSALGDSGVDAASRGATALAVSRLDGVSATVNDGSAGHKPDANAARNALFGGNQPDVSPGHEVILSTDDGRRYALRIAGRTPITDQAVPDNIGALNLLAASGPDTITVVWRNWLYVITAEELGVEPVLAVQQSL